MSTQQNSFGTTRGLNGFEFTDIQEDNSVGRYEAIGSKVGKLEDKKNRAYSNSFVKISKVLEILFPDGIKKELYLDASVMIRVLDKLCRISNGNNNALDEDSWQDCLGYCILMVNENKRTAVDK